MEWFTPTREDFVAAVLETVLNSQRNPRRIDGQQVLISAVSGLVQSRLANAVTQALISSPTTGPWVTAHQEHIKLLVSGAAAAAIDMAIRKPYRGMVREF